MADKRKINCLLMGDFTLNNLAGYLSNHKSLLAKCDIAPFAQSYQILGDLNHECWMSSPDMVIFWSLPEVSIPSFKKVVRFEEVSLEEIYKQVDQFSALILKASKRTKWFFISTWVIPSYQRGLGVRDVSSPTGVRHVLMKMNLRLTENLSKQSNIILLSAENWIGQVGAKAFDPKLWYMGKIPFDQEVFKLAADDIISALRTLNGEAKKLIALDLDNTIWGGIVGDIGFENLRLGGHDPEGEAFQDFQQSLKAMKNRGILLAIVSKNEQELALEAIEKHPEMILRKDDFAAFKINWDDKAQNIVDLSQELNISLDSIVFIDDSAMERARVKEALPEVTVVDWPQNPLTFKRTLESLSCLDPSSITKEDTERTKMLIAERLRKNLKMEISSFNDWLKTLDLIVEVEELNKVNFPRAVQLMNRTNQMNLSTRRMNEEELKQWIEEKNRKLWTFRVKDKFGDYGLVGLISLQISETEASLVDFLLSCRIIGRKVEEVMVATALNYARSQGCEKITSQYKPTQKNMPCLKFWNNSGFVKKDNTFIWDMTKDYPKPEAVQIKEAIYG